LPTPSRNSETGAHKPSPIQLETLEEPSFRHRHCPAISRRNCIMEARSFRLHLILGICLWTIPAAAQFRFDEGETLPKPTGNVNPVHEEKKRQADAAYRGGDFQKVIDLTSEVLRENPSDAIAFYLRASGRVELGARNGDMKSIR